MKLPNSNVSYKIIRAHFYMLLPGVSCDVLLYTALFITENPPYGYNHRED